MKSIVRLAQKYALNINQLRGPLNSKKLDFKNMNIGFYDSIEKNDISIHKIRNTLKKVKDSSLKEFIYTNKEIPENWRHKRNYGDDVLKIMVKDRNILKYIGAENQEEKNKIKINPNKKINFVKTRNAQIENEKVLPDIKNTFEQKSRINDLGISHQSSDLEKEQVKIITEENSIDLSTSRLSRLKHKSKPKTDYTEKEINTILEDFKTNYPIKQKLKELYDKTNYYSSSSLKNNLDLAKSRDYNTTKNIFSNSFVKANQNELINTPKQNRNIFYKTIKNQQIFKRKNVIRQNVFNNLIANRENIISKSIDKNNLNTKLNPITFSDYKNFIKKIKIKNPLVDKNLENINFYGPYFSYCPPCYNKNIEYYNNLEINQCLDLLHHLRKLKIRDNKKIETGNKIFTERENENNNNIK